MKEWIKANGKQIAVAILSLASAFVVVKFPQYRDEALAIGGALGMLGLHLQPVTYGAKDAAPATLPSGDK